MVKTILLFTLLFLPQVSADASICLEVLDVLRLEAEQIYQRCIESYYTRVFYG